VPCGDPHATDFVRGKPTEELDSRLDVFTRVITTTATASTRCPGTTQLYVEIVPLSFAVRVRQARLNHSA